VVNYKYFDKSVSTEMLSDFKSSKGIGVIVRGIDPVYITFTPYVFQSSYK
jgi:hypothetical protein